MNSTTVKFTAEDRKHQHTVLKKYRERGLIPSLQKVARGSGVSVSTAVMFMHGNSQNKSICKFIIRHVRAEAKTVPQDLQDLFALWKK